MTRIQQALCREMHTFDALWHEIHLTLREIPLIFTRRESVVFLCLAGLTLIALDPHDFLDHITIIEAAFVWIFAEGIFAVVYFAILLGIAMLPAKNPQRVYLPIPSAAAFAVTTVFTESLIGALSNGVYIPKIWPDIIAFAAVAQLFEFLFVRYLLPDVLADIRKNAPLPPTQSMLTIGDHTWSIDDIAAISSNQHYLRVDLCDGTQTTVRARISDVIDTIEPDRGLQPHRSWWVARHAGPALISEGRKRWLTTQHGHKIPVARGRIDEVEKWLDTHPVHSSGTPES
ncbi:LytTR family transcriptional regulator [Donghicola sp. C2-DW-16]|uniref:LytTR family transcriptional regulator n=1 Tax=Donghicola mangrovi TaxID=2729614 RepID=A0ABX2PEC1_9RHOB|nr:LytTR family DNA-binding domain-containing protein [Donghicola mangrovi]NVO26989.1 LytTR family transcriptional regulator [Donghicola mangrovi]